MIILNVPRKAYPGPSWYLDRQRQLARGEERKKTATREGDTVEISEIGHRLAELNGYCHPKESA